MASRLCIYCRQIPFDEDLQTVRDKCGSDYWHEDITYPDRWALGTYEKVRERDCPFCELVVSICWSSVASWLPAKPPPPSAEIVVRWQNGGFVEPTYSPLGSYICLTGDGHSSRAYRARASLTEWIDLDDVRRWVSNCDVKDGDFCSPARHNASLPKSHQNMAFRVVDVEQMCIVSTRMPCRYLALSYVWGEPNSRRLLLTTENRESLMRPGSLSKVHELIPDTILDAMTVVRRLHERYLWVDSLCLIQDDVRELEESVAIMDAFYEMSYLTIVAASGSNAYAGLPGIPPTPRNPARLVREVVPGVDLTTITDMHTWLRQSKYATRAWTMQEEILSNRHLIFVNNQVFFQCQFGLFSEAMNARGQELVNFEHPASIYAGVLRDPDDASFTDFSVSMMLYGQRNLTYQSDTLRAAQGMLRRYSRLSGATLFEGLPLPLDRSILFFRDPRTAKHTGRRRRGFPSYSWTGWDYAPLWDSSLEYRTVVRDSDTDNDKGPKYPLHAWISWHCRLEDGTISNAESNKISPTIRRATAEEALSKCNQGFQDIPISINDFDFNSIGATHLPYPVLCFWTVCINLRLTNIQQHDDEGEAGENPRRRYNLEVVNETGQRHGVIDMDSTGDDESQQGKFALIAAVDDGFWALLLKFDDNGMAERRGVVKLSKDVLEHSLPPGPRWREVILG
ncbi:HET-domain-containing protein [Rhizodiscina lignyota]|uniref:HET-domain-containing protein n=1 Tax=Rhizodiscina lignyota TaxID=1504668 RepID=A0A9P4M2X4_9PEZI|nr:HET-domain-containing protein [Rhizodiscina lignyota]